MAAEQATVSGSVLNDGKPVKVDTSVLFFCQTKSATATGTVDALGKFSLTASDPGVGIPAGRYKVEIRPPAAGPVVINSDDYKKSMTTPTAAKPLESSSDIPAKFQSMETSGIALEIKPGSDNKFDLDLAKL